MSISFRLSNNNKWRWWVLTLATYRRTRSPSRLAWSEGRRPLGAILHSSNEPGELSQWFCHDDNTINIVICIIIIINPYRHIPEEVVALHYHAVADTTDTVDRRSCSDWRL